VDVCGSGEILFSVWVLLTECGLVSLVSPTVLRVD
jgi:hypothetical protein